MQIIQILKMGGSSLPVSLTNLYILVSDNGKISRYKFDNYRAARSCVYAVKHGKNVKNYIDKKVMEA